MNLGKYCETLAARLDSTGHDERLAVAALSLQQAFNVAPDEVAFLKIGTEGDTLTFLWPEKLRTSGSIPLKTLDSLAVTTVREGKSFLENNFASKHHASVFEMVRLDSPKSKAPARPKTIQKIMSAPLTRDEAAIGVVQVCRKGHNADEAGADFNKGQLDALSAIAEIIAGHI